MNNTNTTTNNMNKVSVLSNKLDKISESFNIAESTAVSLSNRVEELSSTVVPHTTITDCNNLNFNIDVTNDIDELQEILHFNRIKSDFNLVRDTVTDLIQNSKLIMNNINTSILLGEEYNPELLQSFSALGGLLNNSMKMLMTNYNDLLSIESKIKDRSKPIDKPNNTNMIGGGNNIIIATNTADLIASGLVPKQGV